jgi:hypothetical protein
LLASAGELGESLSGLCIDRDLARSDRRYGYFRWRVAVRCMASSRSLVLRFSVSGECIRNGVLCWADVPTNFCRL